MDLIKSILNLIIPLFLICFVSFSLTRFLDISDFIEKIIIIFLFNWIQIVLGLQFLSLFNQLKILPLFLFHLICSIVCLVFVFLKKVNIKINIVLVWRKVKTFYKELGFNRILKIIMISWIIIIIAVTFFIGVMVPPNNWDSMAYHLTRAAFWNQNHSINHYYTNNLRQVENPINAELGLLWIITFCKSDILVFLVQWFSFLILILTLYKVLRIIKFDKKIAFITIFFFMTLDLIILESRTTQNDLVVAAFLLITLFLIIRIIESYKISFFYYAMAGFAFGLLIGTKGYTYLFVPGFLIFFWVYGKNNVIKLKKFLFLICFCFLGIILFSSYNFIWNYISFGNLFSSQGNINLMRVKNPDIKTFISNIARHLASFYQFKGYDFGISDFIQKILLRIHNLIGLDISSRSTTIEDQYFYMHTPVFNEDASYFGPVFLIFILPSVFYNLVYFLIYKIRKIKDKTLSSKFIKTSKIAILSIVFFAGYNFIFVWQPWAGRLFISFASLIMINFAMLVDFNYHLNKKILFNSILYFILIISIVFSFAALFNNEFAPIIPNKNKSFLSVDYDDRRYYIVNPEMGRVNSNLDLILSHDSNIGLITGDNDWDYIYFGDNFSRNVEYINEEKLRKNDLEDIYNENSFDAIIVNAENKIGFYSQIFSQNILDIRGKDFLKYFNAANQCILMVENDFLHFEISGDDPYFYNTEKFNLPEKEPLLMSLNLYSEESTKIQIYYKDKDSDFNEKNSKVFEIKKGANKINYPIYNTEKINHIRIDLSNNDIRIFFKDISFWEISRNWNFKSEDNFILLYKR